MNWDYKDQLIGAHLSACKNNYHPKPDGLECPTTCVPEGSQKDCTKTQRAYYIYNAAGERVRKVVVKGIVREERYYFGDYEIYHKFVNGELITKRTTVHVADSLSRDGGNKKTVAQVDDDGTKETIRYQYDNHLSSASLELDQTGAIISYEEYHPFGTTSYRSGRTETETSQKRYKYVGRAG